MQVDNGTYANCMINNIILLTSLLASNGTGIAKFCVSNMKLSTLMLIILIASNLS